MENKHHIIFDLDGTLTQSHQGIINSARHALASYGIDNPDTTKLYAFIGPPLLDSFRQQFGFSEERQKGRLRVIANIMKPRAGARTMFTTAYRPCCLACGNRVASFTWPHQRLNCLPSASWIILAFRNISI